MKSLNKNIIGLGFVSFFTDMASSMVTPLIPILVVVILKNDIQTLGQIVAITTFISYGFRIIFGYLGDKYQLTKPFIVIGYGLSAIIKPLYFFAASWQGVAALQSGERMGKAIRSASKDNLISVYADKNKSGQAFGFHKMMDIGGELVGAILVFVLLYFVSDSPEMIRKIFAFTIIPGAIAVLIVIFYVQDAPGQIKNTQYQWQSTDSQLMPVLILYFFSLFFVFSSSFYVIKATDMGYQLAMIPLLHIALNLIQTLTSYYFGIKIDKVGAVNMLLISFVFALLTLGAFWLSYIWLAFIFLGLFTVSSLNAMRSYISHHAINKSTLFGLFYAGTAIFSALGALLTGYLWHQFSQELAVEVSIVGMFLVACGLLFFIIIRGRSQNQVTH